MNLAVMAIKTMLKQIAVITANIPAISLYVGRD